MKFLIGENVYIKLGKNNYSKGKIYKYSIIREGDPNCYIVSFNNFEGEYKILESELLSVIEARQLKIKDILNG